MLGIGGSSLYQNQKLSNGLMIGGAALIITGIALTCINSHITMTLGSVSLSLGTPLLLIGLIMTIFRKCQDNQQQVQTQPQNRGPASTSSPSSGYRLNNTKRAGSDQSQDDSSVIALSAAREERKRKAGEVNDQNSKKPWWKFC